MIAERNTLNYRSEKGIYPSNNFRLLLVSILSAIIGVIAGIVAYGLLLLIALLSNLIFFQRIAWEIPSLQFHTLGAWIIVVPAIGGLIIGLMIKYGTPKISGHGIPEAMEAVLVQRSRIAPSVAILKPISAALAISTGGPFGAEGPIIQTGGALGSLIGQVIHVTAAERKVLLACGAAAGMAAIFGTPIAAVIVAIELLLFEFKSRSFIPLVIASTLATTVHFTVLGRGPLFAIGTVDFGIPSGLPFYLILGVLSGLAAAGFSTALYWVEDQFERLPIDRIWWPALGGLGLGIIGFFFPRVLGVGYDTITDILNNRLGLSILLMVMIFKSLALLISLGSGTSGGLLAPLFMSGAAMGGAFAILVNQFMPSANLDPSAYALAAMAAIFGAAARSSFAFIIFAFEVTQDYEAILPLMLVMVIADGIALIFMRNSIMTEKLARRGLRVHQDYEADVLQQMEVSEVMDANPTTVCNTLPVAELAREIANGNSKFTQHQAQLILNEEGSLVGIITRGDVFNALEQHPGQPLTVMDAGTDNLVVTYPDELLHDAINKMLRHDIGRLPVVAREDASRMVGYLGRSAVLTARTHRLHEEHVREPGWINYLRQPGQMRKP